MGDRQWRVERENARVAGVAHRICVSVGKATVSYTIHYYLVCAMLALFDWKPLATSQTQPLMCAGVLVSADTGALRSFVSIVESKKMRKQKKNKTERFPEKMSIA